MQTIKNFFRNDEGAETVEYAIVVGLIAALAAVAYATSLGTSIQTFLNNLL